MVRSSLWMMGLLLAVTATGCNSGGEGASCLTSRHCGGGLLCDLDRAMCVQCITAVDCPTPGDVCANRHCGPLTACASSRQCPGQVCDPVRGFCADCVTDTDCPGFETCSAGLCSAPPTLCDSDRQCAARDQVCDMARGECADCARDADCDEGRRCSAAGTCVAGDACVSGTTECSGPDAVRTCIAGQLSAPTDCPGTTTCSAGVCTDASCSVVCRAGETCVGNSCSCGGDRCSDNETCVAGTCQTLTCSPVCATGETCVGTQCRCGSAPACSSGDRCEGGLCVPIAGCTASDCGLTPQCGCGPSEGCYLPFADVGETQCQFAGTQGNGSACVNQSDCRAGFLCKELSTEIGVCRPFCRSDAQCSGSPGIGCAIALPGDLSARNAGVQACTGGCDVLTGSGCPAGQGCALFRHTNGVTWVTECRVAAAVEPSFCFDSTECPPRTVCPSSFGACADYCRYPDGACAIGSCQSFDDHPVINGVEYGYCS